MSTILVVEHDVAAAASIKSALGSRHHLVLAPTGTEALDALTRTRLDALVLDLQVPDVPAVRLLGVAQQLRRAPHVIALTRAARVRDAVAAVRLGAAMVLEHPVDSGTLQRLLEELPISAAPYHILAGELAPEGDAMTRWADAVVSVIESARDPRTLSGWARWITVPLPLIRQWCRAVNVGTRRSLLFARMLRASAIAELHRQMPSNLLDVVDRRTLDGLLTLAGFQRGESDFPHDPETFIDRQRLIDDRDALAAIRRALAARREASRLEPFTLHPAPATPADDQSVTDSRRGKAPGV